MDLAPFFSGSTSPTAQAGNGLLGLRRSIRQSLRICEFSSTLAESGSNRMVPLQAEGIWTGKVEGHDIVPILIRMALRSWAWKVAAL